VKTVTYNLNTDLVFILEGIPSQLQALMLQLKKHKEVDCYPYDKWLLSV